jgi:4-alpha-glucanotransferase
LVNGGFAAFLATVRAVLRRAGGIRIDHAMGLTRLWLIPEGAEPADGAYLAYPLMDLLRLLALESQRHSAIVVGEDLGTLPDGFRETLDAAGLHGMRVLWFERDRQGFTSPAEWTQSAVAMTSTHDLPTTAGWWRGRDISARAECGRLGVGESEEQLVAKRASDRGQLWRAFTDAGVTDGEQPASNDPADFVDAALAFGADTGSPLFIPPIEDVLGVEEQPNLPGTTDQHPNWRRRLPSEVSALFDEPRVAARVAKLAARRPRL